MFWTNLLKGDHHQLLPVATVCGGRNVGAVSSIAVQVRFWECRDGLSVVKSVLQDDTHSVIIGLYLATASVLWVLGFPLDTRVLAVY